MKKKRGKKGKRKEDAPAFHGSGFGNPEKQPVSSAGHPNRVRASQQACTSAARETNCSAHRERERGTRDCVLQDRDVRHLSCYYCVSSSRRALIPIRRRMQQQIFCGPGKSFPPSYLQLFFKIFFGSETLLKQPQLQRGDRRSFVLQGEFCNLQGGKKSDTKEEKPQVTE